MSKVIRILVFALASAVGLILVACGPVPAGTVINIAPDGQSAQVQFMGKVDTISASQWVISGHPIQIDQQTSIGAGIAAGNPVQVSATVTKDGSVTADAIKLALGSLVSGSQSNYSVEYLSTAETDTPTPTTSGTETGTPEAVTPTPSDTPGATLEPTESGTPEATATDEPEGKGFKFSGQVNLVGSVGSIATDQWVVSGLTFMIGPKTKIAGTFAVGDLVHVHAVVNTDGSFTALEIGPAGENANAHGSITFVGTVASEDTGKWVVDNQTVGITDQTKIHGSPAVGDTVIVIASINPDGTLTGLVIQALKAFGDDHHRPPEQTPEGTFVIGTPGGFHFGQPDGDNDGDDMQPQMGTPSFIFPTPFHFTFPGGGGDGGHGGHH